jgi:hypothetical protein
MAKKAEGIKYIDLGQHWRALYRKGRSIISIADQFKENKQVVSRAIWLAKIPDDIKEIIRNNPEIFTCRVLLNGFAGKRRMCELNAFKFLRSEVLRMATAGAGSIPKFPKSKKKLLKTSRKETHFLRIHEVIEAEYKIKEALGFHTHVRFDTEGAGEVRIFIRNKKDLDALINMISPVILT